MERSITHKNNFDFLRFLFASLVIISHSYFLFYGDLNKDPFYVLTGRTLSGFAVCGFFILSGFLIQQSRERSSGVYSFFRKRAVRIVPGLWIALLFSVFIIGTIFTQLPTIDYLKNTGTWKYLAANLLLIPQQFLPELFTTNPTAAVNGSIWTLRYEILFYIFLGMFFFVPKKSHRPFLLSTLLLCSITIWLDIQLPQYLYNIFNLGFYFLSGAVLAGYKDFVITNKSKLLIISCLTFAISFFFLKSRYAFLMDCSFVMMVLSFGLHYFPILHFSKYTGDISYGTYIYAYPVQQAILLWLQPKDVFTFMLYAFLFVWPLGFLSWQLIEKPFLKKKSS